MKLTIKPEDENSRYFTITYKGRTLTEVKSLDLNLTDKEYEIMKSQGYLQRSSDEVSDEVSDE